MKLTDYEAHWSQGSLIMRLTDYRAHWLWGSLTMRLTDHEAHWSWDSLIMRLTDYEAHWLWSSLTMELTDYGLTACSQFSEWFSVENHSCAKSGSAFARANQKYIRVIFHGKPSHSNVRATLFSFYFSFFIYLRNKIHLNMITTQTC